MKKFKSIVAASLAAAMIVGSFAACTSGGGSNPTTAAPTTGGSETQPAGGDETQAPAEETTPGNQVSGDITADSFVVWGWNDDIKKILDSVYANDEADNYSKIVFVNAGGADYYQTKIDELLKDAGNDLYPDMMGLEIDYVQKYVQSGKLISLADLGVSADDLKNQYKFNVDVCSTGGVQYASFWQATPGAWCIRADLAEKYLGTTDPAELQEMFKDWAAVEATAQKVYDASEGNCRLLSGWDDLNRVFMNNRKSGWYNADDVITVDDQVKGFFEEAKKFKDNNWTFETTQWSSDWDSMKGGDGTADAKSALAFTGCPWFQYWCLPADSWEGQCITIKGPQDFYWGGTGLAVPEGCANKEIAASIIKYFTCDSESMQKIAKFNADFINNAEANVALLDYSKTDDGKMLASGNGLMHSQNYVETYNTILNGMTVDTSIVTAEDKMINDKISDFVKAYIESGDYDAAINDMKAWIHDTFEYLNVQ